MKFPSGFLVLLATISSQPLSALAEDRQYDGLAPATIVVFMEAENNHLSNDPSDYESRWAYHWKEKDLNPTAGYPAYLREIIKDRNPNLNAVRKDGLTPLATAIENNNIPAVGILISDPRTDLNKEVKGKTPLMLAIERHDVISVQALLKQRGRIDVNKRTSLSELGWGHTALSVALRKAVDPRLCLGRVSLEKLDLIERCERSDQIIDLILSSPDLDVNQTAHFDDRRGAVPIAIAAMSGQVKAVKRLLADPRLDRGDLRMARHVVSEERDTKVKQLQNITDGAAAFTEALQAE